MRISSASHNHLTNVPVLEVCLSTSAIQHLSGLLCHGNQGRLEGHLDLVSNVAAQCTCIYQVHSTAKNPAPIHCKRLFETRRRQIHVKENEFVLFIKPYGANGFISKHLISLD